MSQYSRSQVNEWNKQVTEEFRANGGKVGGSFEGTPLLLLTTIGKKSGQPRVSPLAYRTDGERLIVVASFRGAPKHPDWYFNLVAHPNVTVEVGEETFEAVASTAEGMERERLLKDWPFVMEHQAKVEREIPLVVLHRIR